MEVTPIGQGKAFAVYAVSRSASRPSIFEEYVANLPEEGRKKVARAVVFLEDHGKHPSIEKCRHLGNGVWELKEGLYRVMFFSPQANVVVLTHGFQKNKGPKTQDQKNTALKLIDAVEDEFGWSPTGKPIRKPVYEDTPDSEGE